MQNQTISRYNTRGKGQLPDMVGTSTLRARDVTNRIREHLRAAEASFISAGEELEVAHELKAWEALGFPSWRAYCEKELNISDSLADELIRIASVKEQFPEYEGRILDAGVSKMRLLLPTLGEHTDEATLDGLLDEANTKSYRELRQTIKGATDGGGERDEYPLPPAVFVCPNCHTEIKVTRATTIVGWDK